MNILITGASGLIGSELVNKLYKQGHLVKILTRKIPDKPFEYQWNPEKKLIDETALEGTEIIVHLAGASIGKKWTPDYKKELYDSRVESSRLLLETCKKKNIKLKAFISASGINYYGTYTSDKILTEEEGVQHQDFLSLLTQDWENAAFDFREIAERVVCLRTALVLSKKGGAFEKIMKNPASPLGSGKQWVCWIHLEDLVNMYVTSIENTAVEGTYNALADEILRQEQFTKKLAKALKKIYIPIHTPAWLLKMILGEMSEIVLQGTRASNKKIKDCGFSFEFPTLDKAFKDLII